MKLNAPEKIYLQVCGDCNDNDCENCKFEDLEDNVTWCIDKIFDKDIEYIRTDVFIEKALKWYCLDCECNDNCKDTKCFFYREYERYLKGETNALPPKISDRILNEDGRPSDNWRYRHFITKIQDAFIDKACSWLKENKDKYLYNTGEKGEYIPTCSGKVIDEFRKYMKGE